jgi:hypothetical protein
LLAFGCGIELDVESALDLDERVAAVLLPLRDDSGGGRLPSRGDRSPLGVEREALERAAAQPGEDEVLRRPVGVKLERSACHGEGVLEPLGH